MASLVTVALTLILTPAAFAATITQAFTTSVGQSFTAPAGQGFASPALTPAVSVAGLAETFAGPGTAAGQVEDPEAVAVDQSTGTVYVGERNSRRVSEFNAGGHFLRAFGYGVLNGANELQTCTTTCGVGLETGLTPSAVAVDQASHEVYVVDSHSQRVEKFTPLGEFRLMFGKEVNKTKVAQFNEPGNPHHVTESEEGICSKANIEVEHDTCGAGVSGSGPDAINTGFFGLTFSGSALAVDSTGNVWVGQENRLERFSSAGAFLSEVSLSGVGIVTSLTVNVAGDFYAIGSSSAGILKLEPSGAPFGAPYPLDASGHPQALALDPATGNLFVADRVGSESGNGEVSLLEFDSSGAQTEALGSGEVIGSPIGGALSFGDAEGGRLYVVSSTANQGSAGQIFTQPPPGPMVEVGSTKATEVKKTTATLNATINPEGRATTYHFQYLSETAFKEDGNSFGAGTEETPESDSIGEDFTAHEVSVAIPSLAVATVYRVRIVAHNEEGTSTGGVTSFETLPPAVIDSTSAAEVTAGSVTLQAQINPLGDSTSYRFEYLTEALYLHNERAGEPLFTGAAQAPLTDAQIGSGTEDVSVSQHLQELVANTAYRYRVVIVNSVAPTGFGGPVHTFTTQGLGGSLALADGREWELVSPPNKYGAQIRLVGYGLTQAAADGDALVYSADAATEVDSPGGALATQVFATRGEMGSSPWFSRDISPPHKAATGAATETEYGFFSTDLSLALLRPHGAFEPLLSPEASEQTPFIRSDYLGGNVTEPCIESCYRPLVTGCSASEPCAQSVEEHADVPVGTAFGEEGLCPSRVECGPKFLDSTPDISHVVLTSTIALTSAGTGGLYEYSADAPPDEALQLISVLPGVGSKPANDPELGAEGVAVARNAISTDGSRVIWSVRGGHLYLRDHATRPQSAVSGSEQCMEPTEGCTIQLDVVQGGSGFGAADPTFQDASVDGSRVFFTDTQLLTEDAGATPGEPDLYECEIVEEAAGVKCDLTDLTPFISGQESADVQGIVPGISEDGSYVYFVADGVLSTKPNVRDEVATPGGCQPGTGIAGSTCNLYLYHDGARTFIAALSGGDFPDWVGNGGGLRQLTTRVSANGDWLAFMSDRSLTGYDTRDVKTDKPDEEVYLYHAGASGEGGLICASCNPTGGRPLGVEFVGSSEFGGASPWLPQQGLAANVPGWTSYNGHALYQSRYLSSFGRLFFNSADALLPQDTNGTGDVYEYEPPGSVREAPANDGCGVGSADYSPVSEGCVELLSSGTSQEESDFFDASESGDDVFFATNAQLSLTDTDTSRDVYDAHVCSAESPCAPAPPPPPPACEGDACQSPGSAPEDQTPASLTYRGPGDLEQSLVGASTKPKSKAKQLTRAQKLAKALKACHVQRNRKKRLACQTVARRKYGAKQSIVSRKRRK